MIFDPLDLSAEPTATAEFTAHYAGHSFSFKMRSLDELELIRTVGLAEDLEVRYVTGGWLNNSGEVMQNPERFITGRSHTDYANVNKYILMVLCRLELMIIEPKYTIFQLAAFAKKAPPVWEKLAQTYQELMNPKKKPEDCPTGSGGLPLSDPESPLT